MSAKASSDAVKGETQEEKNDMVVTSKENVQGNAKQKSSSSPSSAKKKRRPTTYTPEFKAEILEFVKENKNNVAVRVFGIPESTLRDWISKASKRDSEEAATRLEMNGNTSSPGTSPIVINQEAISMIVDIPGLVQASSRNPSESLIEDDDNDAEEPTNNKDETEPSNSPKKIFTSSFKEMVVKFGEGESWKAAGEKFDVPAHTVGLWARQLGRRRPTKSKGIIVDDETRDKAVRYSLQMNSWKRAAQKFGFSPEVVAFWGKKAGCKLKSKMKSHAGLSDEVKDSIVRYAVKHNSWSRAAQKYGVPQHIVAFWGKKAGCKLNLKYPDGFKEAVVSFGQGSSWKEAATKFGVAADTVRIWAKQMGKEKKVKYPDGFKETVVNFGQGRSWNAAASKFGLAALTVRRWAKQMGKGKEGPLGEKAKEEIIKYGVEHKSWKEAAAKFGVSPHTVYFWGKKAGYKLKGVGGKKKSSSSGDVPQPHLNKLNQSLLLNKDPEELGKGINNHDVLSKEVASSYDHDLKTTAKNVEICNKVVFKWSKKLKVRRVEADSEWSKVKAGDYLGSESCTVVGGIMKGSPVKSNIVLKQSVAPVDTVSSRKHEEKVECEACGKALAADETLDEHVVSVHLTIEGLCNICGEDSDDFVDHFKVHLKSCNDDVELAALDIIKKENPDIDDNQNVKNYTECDLVIKEENEVKDGETLKGKRWFINPFYSC